MVVIWMENKNCEIFWNASIDEIKNGYVCSDGEIRCLVCGERFEQGQIYQIDSKFYDASKAVQIHIKKDHGSMLNYIVNMNSTFTGISEAQSNMILLFAEGFSDKEIATKLGLAQSTIRNHRYKLREREKQAKLFLAVMELLSNSTKKNINMMDDSIICDAHKSATTLDDRFNITDKEKEKTIATYMDENGGLKTYPSKEKKKIIILEAIAKNFKRNEKYSEKQVNMILKRIYEEDYITLRRALVEYGFLDRPNDCSSYWVKE